MAKKEELFVQAAQSEHRAGGAVGSAPLLYGISDRRGRCVRRRIGIRVVVNPPEILAATVHAVRAASVGLKGAPTPVVAIFQELAAAIRLAVYLASDERLARSGLGAVAMMVAAARRRSTAAAIA